jgi:uncharacterized DUF497 family protein
VALDILSAKDPEQMLFEWDEANITHIAEHEVSPAEAEQVIDDSPLYLDYSIQSGEVRHREIGETATGRILVVVSTTRVERIRVITAYSPSRSLRKIYLTYKESEQHGKARSS